MYIHKLFLVRILNLLAERLQGIMTFAFLKNTAEIVQTLYKKPIIDVRTPPHTMLLANHLTPETDIHEHNLCYIVLFDVICRNVF